MATNDAAEDSPDSLDLKKRSRRRLVGAAALALLAIIVLPIVMDNEPKPVAQDIQIRIPSQDGDGLATKAVAGKSPLIPVPPQDKTSEVLPPVAKLDESTAKAETKSEAKPDAKSAAKADAKADTKSDAKAADSKAKAEAKSADKSADKGTDKAKTEKAQDKPATKDGKDGKKAEEARAAAALEGKSSSGQWVVQLGAYQNTGNVKLLLSKIKELGLPAYTEKLDGPDGAKTRVRAGPFPSQDAAEKARTKIKIIGVDGPVGQK
jgi:DedD protein